MTQRSSPTITVPRASGPQVLLRLVGHVAAGVRAPETLAQLLNCQVSTLHDYLQTAEWLGLVEPDEGAPAAQRVVRLTRLGLSLAYGDRRQDRIYAEAVLGHPFIRSLLGSRLDELPTHDVVARFIARRFPDMAPATLNRRCSAVRSLLEPAMRVHLGRVRSLAGTQLSLGFPAPRPPATQDRLRVLASEADLADDPAVYRVILQHMLDEGELALSHLRAIMDDVGATAAAVGGYAEMAVRRGDAWRFSDGLVDKLVITPGAIARRDVSDTLASVALSDPDYRAYLEILCGAERGDPAASMKYTRVRTRFTHWDRRLFGAGATPRDVARAMGRLLLGRPLDLFPIASPVGQLVGAAEIAPFIEQTSRDGLFLALPPSLGVLTGGLQVVNRLLVDRRTGPQRVAMPSPVDPRFVVHGGLLHPGEKIPRALPDNVTLRLQLISRSPYFTFLSAFLVMHRRSAGRLSLRVRGDQVRVIFRRRDRGGLLDLVDRLARGRGWQVTRRFRGGLSEAAMVEICQNLGLAFVCDDRLILDEDFFVRLRNEPEDREVFGRLDSFADSLEAALSATPENDGSPQEDDDTEGTGETPAGTP